MRICGLHIMQTLFKLLIGLSCTNALIIRIAVRIRTSTFCLEKSNAWCKFFMSPWLFNFLVPLSQKQMNIEQFGSGTVNLLSIAQFSAYPRAWISYSALASVFRKFIHKTLMLFNNLMVYYERQSNDVFLCCYKLWTIWTRTLLSLICMKWNWTKPV